MDFKTMDISTVIRGTRNDGVRYLQLFLQEYTAIFKEKVNPGCTNCVTAYLDKYKNHFNEMENPCKYRLHAKYENIPLEFGSPILVNNGNITDEYAQTLLSHNNGERYFAAIPPVPVPVINVTIGTRRTRPMKIKKPGTGKTGNTSNTKTV